MTPGVEGGCPQIPSARSPCLPHLPAQPSRGILYTTFSNCQAEESQPFQGSVGKSSVHPTTQPAGLTLCGSPGK